MTEEIDSKIKENEDNINLRINKSIYFGITFCTLFTAFTTTQNLLTTTHGKSGSYSKNF
jgi:hypothetical protein